VLTRVMSRWAGAAPVVARVIVGSMMFAHGLDKINSGPTGFGEFLDAELGLPAGVALGWIVTFLELIGGAMLVVGLFSRVVAALLTLELIRGYRPRDLEQWSHRLRRRWVRARSCLHLGLHGRPAAGSRQAID